MLSPSTIVQNMKTLDRSLFQKSVNLLALKIPVHKASSLMKLFSNYLLNWPKQRNIVSDDANPNNESKLLLLNPKYQELAQLPKDLLQTAIPDTDLNESVSNYTLKLTYEYWTADEIFKSIFPPDTEIVTSIEIVGDIGHVNLRDHLLPSKQLIGEVLLDKNPSLNTIINKTSQIETTFRTFPYEILATRVPEKHTTESLLTRIHQSQIYFHLDFAKVYWNSRLQTEHERLVRLIQPHSLVADVMCGIGPFALPLAKHQTCLVFANDLNPACFQYLNVNIKKNNLAGLVHSHNEDARAFITTSSLNQLNKLYQTISDEPKFLSSFSFKKKEDQEKVMNFRHHLLKKPLLHFQHYIMNLPASALTFLDAFHGLYLSFKSNHGAYLEQNLPWVHVYCFSHASPEELQQDIKSRIEEVLNTTIATLQVHIVRCVAPKKLMCCASFQLPATVVFAPSISSPLSSSDEPKLKKLKCDHEE